MKISIKRTFKVLAVGLALIVLASCSSRPENLALVPKDTNLVATTNLTSLATKGGMENLEQAVRSRRSEADCFSHLTGVPIKITKIVCMFEHRQDMHGVIATFSA